MQSPAERSDGARICSGFVPGAVKSRKVRYISTGATFGAKQSSSGLVSTLPAAARYLPAIMSLGPRALPAGFIAPCLPTKAPEPPSGTAWVHEIKHDGIRVITRKTET